MAREAAAVAVAAAAAAAFAFAFFFFFLFFLRELEDGSVGATNIDSVGAAAGSVFSMSMGVGTVVHESCSSSQSRHFETSVPFLMVAYIKLKMV